MIIAIYLVGLLLIHLSIGLKIADVIILATICALPIITVFRSLLLGLISAFIVTLIYGFLVIFTGTSGLFLPLRVNYIYLFLPILITLIATIVDFEEGDEKEIKEQLSLLERINDLSFKSSDDYLLHLEEEISKSKEDGTHVSLMMMSIQPYDQISSLYESQYHKRLDHYLSDEIINMTHTIDCHYEIEAGVFFIILPNTPDEKAIHLEEYLISKFETIDISSEEAIAVDMNIAYRTNKDYMDAKVFHDVLYNLLKEGNEND